LDLNFNLIYILYIFYGLNI